MQRATLGGGLCTSSAILHAWPTLLPACSAYFEQRHAQLQAELFGPNPAAFPADTFSLDAFLWAACTVRARSHAPLDGPAIALVPLADMVRGWVGGAGSVGWPRW